MTERKSLCDLKTGDIVVVPHPMSNAFVVARIVATTKRGAKINYWSSSRGDWSPEVKTRFFDDVCVLADGTDPADASAALLEAWKRLYRGQQQAEIRHTEEVYRIASGVLAPPPDRTRALVAKLYCAGGCGCCRDDEGWEEAQAALGTLFDIPRYPDDSGFDWYIVRDEARQEGTI